MTDYSAHAATSPTYDLAEGVLWDDRAGRVRFVNISAGAVHSGRLERGSIVDVEVIELGQTAGAVALADDGGLLVAAARGLATISPSGVVSIGPDLLGDRADVRLNDGSVDPQGRFLVGTMALGDDSGAELLLRVSADGSVETLRDRMALSNGIGFSPDGGTIYHVDTRAGTVSSHSYRPGPFDHDEPWSAVLRDLPHSPDGLTVDAEGALWVAQWGGSGALRFSPAGTLIDSVAADATQVSCPAFVGPDLDILALTSAQEGLGEWSDLSGAIFLADVHATGLPTPRWAGSTTNPYWIAEEHAEHW